MHTGSPGRSPLPRAIRFCAQRQADQLCCALGSWDMPSTITKVIWLIVSVCLFLPRLLLRSVLLVQRSFGMKKKSSKIGPGIVLCLGDSLTFGYHSYGHLLAGVQSPYCIPLAKMVEREAEATRSPFLHDIVFENHGVNGSTVAEILEAGKARLRQPGRVRCAIILGGTNDIGTNVDEARSMRNLRKLHCLAHARGIPTLALTLPSRTNPPEYWVAKQRSINDKIREMVKHLAKKGRPICLVDVSHLAEGRTEFLKDEAGDDLHDNLHLAPSDYEEMAECCFQPLVDALLHV